MTRVTPFLAIVSIAALAGCGSNNNGPTTPTMGSGPSTTAPAASAPAGTPPAAPTTAPISNGTQQAAARAHATLQPSSGSDVGGQLAFVATGDGVHITGRITGLKPDSTHGFHIHEHGNCSAPDAASAGGHFNPQNQPHGQPSQGPRHAGDLPNQHANDQGVATVDVTTHDISLGTGNANDALDGAIIVHAQADDYSSQPSGNSGARVACGVITRD